MGNAISDNGFTFANVNAAGCASGASVAWQDVTSAATYCSYSDAVSVGNASAG